MLRHPHFGIMGIPFLLGQPLEGVKDGPSFLRSCGMVSGLKRLTRAVTDWGDLKFSKELKRNSLQDISQASHLIYSSAKQIHRVSQIPIHLGGDHGLAVGSVAASLEKYPNLSVIWVDAHGDMNTPQESQTGNFHGMPLAALMGRFQRNEHEVFSWVRSFLPPERLVLLGIRDLDRSEKQVIRDLGIFCLTALEVKEMGVGRAIQMGKDHLNRSKGGPVHLSFDIDALDPSVAPATGTRVKEGLTLEEGIGIVRGVSNSFCCVGMDLVEFNPQVKKSPYDHFLTAHAGIQLVKEFVKCHLDLEQDVYPNELAFSSRARALV